MSEMLKILVDGGYFNYLQHSPPRKAQMKAQRKLGIKLAYFTVF